jgi:hypothetical protein
VSNAVLRVLPSIGALLAALLIAGAGAGVAIADPDGTGDDTTGTGEPADPPAVTQPTVVAPEPTTATPPSIFDIPRNIATQLRDMLGRPLSIFGNGRTPGTHILPDGTVGDSSKRKRDKDRSAVEKPEPTAPEQAASTPTQQAPRYRHTTGSVGVTPPPSVPPIPATVQVPGYQGKRWTLDLSDPFAAFTAMGQTLSTVNSLLADAYAPYNPFKPKPKPTPQPAPTFRIMEEAPVEAIDTVDTTPMANGSDLPVVQAPVIIPPIRLAPSRPITGSVPARGSEPATGSGSVPAGEGTQVLGAGPAGAPAPAVRGSVPPTGATPTPSTSAMFNSGFSSGSGNPVLREGYPQYLRSARITQVATVALPGLAGLIALTASGGVIGYRQANSGRYLRSEAERFIQ